MSAFYQLTDKDNWLESPYASIRFRKAKRPFSPIRLSPLSVPYRKDRSPEPLGLES